MFTGPTAQEWATINATAGDAPEPHSAKPCEGYGDHDGERPMVDPTEMLPIYGVGCVIIEWQAFCENCRDSYGSGDDVFYCEGCNHEHETHTSWELHYSTNPETGEALCLKCAADEALAAPDFWVSEIPTDFDNWLRSRRHFPEAFLDGKATEFGEGATLDSMDGHVVSGSDLREVLDRAIAEHGRAGVVIERAYQFAVYLEVVVPVAA